MSYKINGSLIEVSESEDNTKRTAKFLLCPLDEANLNGKGIKKADISEDELKTLIGQPLVTKLIYNSKTNTYDFSGHLRKKAYKRDNNGNVIEYSDFTSTSPIGYHTDVSIEDIDFGDSAIKSCIVGVVTLWTRYYHAMEVIDRLGTSLNTSWELEYDETYDEDGVTWLKGIKFLANCVLGTNINPAYKDAGLLEVAEEEQDELAEAMKEDLILLSSQSDNSDRNIKETNNKGGHNNMADENKTELSSLTMEDLYSKVRKAIRKATDEDKWYYISYLYPIDFKAIAHSYEDEETKFVEFTYAVSENGDVSITGKTDVEMVFVPKLDNEIEISKLKDQLSSKETELSQKVDEIVKLGETIQSLNDSIAEKDKEISELEPIKQEMAEKKAKEEEAELTKKKCELSEMLIASKYFTKEEIEISEEIQGLINNLDESALKIKIAEKVVEQASKIVETKSDSKENKDDKKSKTEISSDLNSQSEYDYDDDDNSFVGFFKRNK